MIDIRKIIIIFVVAILFSVLVFSVIEAAYPSPEWNDYCDNKLYREPQLIKDTTECEELPVSTKDKQECSDKEGYIAYERDSKGCATSFYCETCENDYDNAREQYNQYVFYISAILSLIAIFVGMYLPAEENTLNEWMGTGFMLGGAFALFFGTAQSFGDLGRFVRPIVIFVELALVIFIAYRKIGNLKLDKKKK